MKQFFIVFILVVAGLIGWRYSPDDIRQNLRQHTKMTKWLVIGALVILFAIVFALSNFSIKVF